MLTVDTCHAVIGTWSHIDVPDILVATIAIHISPTSKVDYSLKLVGHATLNHGRFIELPTVVIEHLATYTSVSKDGEREVLIREGIVPAEGIFRQTTAQEGHILSIDDAIAIVVLVEQVAHGGLQPSGIRIAHDGSHTIVRCSSYHGTCAIPIVAEIVGCRIDTSCHLITIVLADTMTYGSTSDGLTSPRSEVQGLVYESVRHIQTSHLILVQGIRKHGLPVEFL